MVPLNCRLNNWPSFLLLGIGFTLLFLVGSLQASIIEQDYSFPPPQVKVVGEYHRVEMAGLVSLGGPGEPVLPVGVAKLLLPFGEKIEAIEVIPGQKVPIEESYIVEPGQPPLPLNFRGPYSPVPPREEIYSSSDAYPGKSYSLVTVQSLCGYRIAFVNLYPVEYIPSQGRLYWYRSFKLRVVAAPSADVRISSRRMLKGSPSVLQRIEALVDNPKEVNSYQGVKALMPLHSFLVDPTDDYEYVIITNGELNCYFQPLADFHTGRGVKAGIFLVEDIYAEYEGSDDQEKIRNFVNDCYQNWPIEYVLLGGDDEIVPHRGFYSYAPGHYDYDIPSDLYYGGLDGNWNNDGDDRWGEPGEDDLLAEVWVGRMAVDSGQEAQNFINKVISYQETPVTSDCIKGLMVGEDLMWVVWGKDYKEEIREGSSNWEYTTVGFPEWFNVGTLYDKDSPWGKDDLIGLMNSGQHLINHLGHADVTYALKMNNPDVDNSFTNDGVNEGYFIIYTQGCYCNAFDNRTTGWDYTEDAISEHFTGIANGAVAFMGNTRYGWGSYSTTDGPSQYYDRQFFDALFGEGLTGIGEAFQDSKEDNIGYIDGDCMRWCYYQLCLLGDPLMDIWTKVPEELYVEHPSVAEVGPALFSVAVSLQGEPVKGALVCLQKGDEVYETGYTDTTGQVTLYPCPITPGTMGIAVTTHNGLPYQDQVTVIPAEGPYVTYYSHRIDDDTLGTSWGNGDGGTNPGELIELPLWVKNWGNNGAYGVEGVLRTDDPYVTITDSTEEFGDIASGDTVISSDDPDFEVGLDCPNGHIISFSLECKDSQDSSWVSYAQIMVKAVVIAYDSLRVDDSGSSQPNGEIDPGETVNLILTLKNTGYADAYGVEAVLITDDGYVSIISDQGSFGNIPAGGSASNSGSPYVIYVVPQCPLGYLISFSLGITDDWGYAALDSFNLRVNTIFTDVASSAGVGNESRGYGIAFGDYDNDGDQDIYVANARTDANVLYRNNGDGTFTDVTDVAGVGDSRYGTGVAFGDYDNDGDLDIYLCDYEDANVLYRNNGNGTFTDVTDQAGVGEGNTAKGVAWGNYDGDSDLDLYVVSRYDAGILYRNNGNGTFTDVTQEAGVSNSGGQGWGVAWGDYDNDGDLDLCVVNGSQAGGQESANVLYRNNGNGTFTDVTGEAGVGDRGNSHGCAFGDYDNDGYLDLYVTNTDNQADILYRNNKDGTFIDVTQEAEVVNTGYPRGVAFGDFDNDGYLDIYVVDIYQANILFHNNGDGTFTDISDIAGVGSTKPEGTLTLGDFDNDGDLDIYLVAWGEANVLYRNSGNDNHWLVVKTKGVASNRDGIGARVRVIAGELSMVREVSGGSGSTSQNSLPVEFGLGAYPQADTVTVSWPSGVVSALYSVDGDSAIEIVERAGCIVGRVSNVDDSSQGLAATVEVVETGHETVADSLGDYRLGVVGDRDYTIKTKCFGFIPDSTTVFVPTDSTVTVNFALYSAPCGTLQGLVLDSVYAQPISEAVVSILNTPLPSDTTDPDGFYGFSTVPGCVFYDVRVIATGYLPSTKRVFIYGNLTNVLDFQLKLVPFTNVATVAGVGDESRGHGVAFGDYDNDGDQDIYISNDWPDANILYRNNGDGTFADVTTVAGVGDSERGAGVAFGDYDNDGDLDIYLAISQDSDNILYRNNGDGTFTDVASEAGVDRAYAGEGVAWGDYDNNGDLDLYLVSRYYGGILYRNNGDRTFTDVTEEAGVGHSGGQGWGTTWGDYDNDGDLDLYVVKESSLGGKESANILYRNNGNGTFTDVTGEAGVGYTGNSRGCAFGDYDNDGYLDLYVTNSDYQADVLYRNNGDGTFTNVTQEAGVANTGWGKGVAFGDFDNDGYLDIYVMNAFQAHILFHNNGDGTFADISDMAGVGSTVLEGGLTLGDFDNDGDLDIYLAAWGKANILYRNNGNDNHWLVVRTRGVASSRDGIGARVRVVAGELSLVREVSGGSGYLSQNSLPVEFGLGPYPQADTIAISWPSGIADTFYAVNADSFYTAIEGGQLVGIKEVRQHSLPKVFSLSQNYPNPFNPFTNISYALPEDCEVRLNIYNVLGKRVKVLVNERKKAGYYCVFWDGRNERGKQVSSGIYFSRMEAGNFKSTKKMALLR